MEVFSSLLTCQRCGKNFVFPASSKIEYSEKGWQTPKKCPLCRSEERKIEREASEKDAKLEYDAHQAILREKELAAFEEKLKAWKVVPYDSITVSSGETLYILGNGFDIMHGVKSSYYSFRDTLGKNNRLRLALENYFNVSDIWADLEEGLAHFDPNTMLSSGVIDANLDLFDAYKEDSGIAEYDMAIETAIWPIITIVNELPKRFRSWVDTLTVGTNDRPLSCLFGDGEGKVLSFNYNEFAEDMYGVKRENVCYIHGCRRKVKGRPRERLIVGHRPDISIDTTKLNNAKVWRHNAYNRGLVKIAQGAAIDLLLEYDKDLTKNCSEIIQSHEDFFLSLANIKNIVTIGHGFSAVDWDYYFKINELLPDAKWYFGCFRLNDLINLEALCDAVKLSKDNVTVFRTDPIRTERFQKEAQIKASAIAPAKSLTLAVSDDGSREIVKSGCTITIVDTLNEPVFEAVFPLTFNRALFARGTDVVILFKRGFDESIYCLNRKDDSFDVVELANLSEHNILTRQLRHVFICQDRLTFVYNNRVREYDLTDGSIVKNASIKNAKDKKYDGIDLISKISGA